MVLDLVIRIIVGALASRRLSSVCVTGSTREDSFPLMSKDAVAVSVTDWFFK